MNAEALIHEHQVHTAQAMLGSIAEHQRSIKQLLKQKAQITKKVQTALDQKAKTKTPLNERQVRIFGEFTDFYTQEGGLLQEALMRMECTYETLHTQSAEPLWLSLLSFQLNQRNAIDSLRRIIAFGEKLIIHL
jgi:hypothetical protein